MTDPFSSVRVRKNSQEAHLVQANLLLSAIDESLGANRSSLAYFGALMSSLQQHSEEFEPAILSAMLYLLSLASSASPRFFPVRVSSFYKHF